MESSVREVRFRPRVRAQVLGLVPYAVVLVVLAVTDLDPVPGWVRWLIPLLLVVSAAMRVVFLWLVLRQPWGVLLDADGVHWYKFGRHLGWSQVAEVRVFAARGWRRALPHRPDRVVLVTAAELDFAARARSRPLGHTVDTSEVKATAEQIAAAVRRFTDAPVRRGHKVVTLTGSSRHL